MPPKKSHGSALSNKQFSTHKSERTFQNVLNVATKLFEEKGFRATTMRDISAHSGLALGAIYYYFRSKEEMVALFYERINKETIDAFRAKHKMGKLENSYKDFVELKIRHLEPHKDLLIILLKEAVDPNSAISLFSKETAAARKLNLDLFVDMIKSNRTTPLIDISDAAYLLWLAHLAILALWIFDRTQDHRATDKLVASVASMIGWLAKLAKIPGFDLVSKKLVHSVLSIFQVNK